MSQAFVREGDEQSLGDIMPTLNALIQFLTRDNNGVRVYERKSHEDSEGRVVHEMSNGLHYTKGKDGRWTTLPL